MDFFFQNPPQPLQVCFFNSYKRGYKAIGDATIGDFMVYYRRFSTIDTTLKFPIVASTIVVWPIPPPIPANFVRPERWAEKHFGQWCRNMSMNRHTQCPRGSPFHWYICCGEGMAECCFGIQTWVFVMFGSLLAVFLAIIVFAIWLGSSNVSAGNCGSSTPMISSTIARTSSTDSIEDGEIMPKEKEVEDDGSKLLKLQMP